MRPDAIGELLAAASRRAGLAAARHAASAAARFREQRRRCGVRHRRGRRPARSRLGVLVAGVSASRPGPAAGGGGRGAQPPRAGGGDVVTGAAVGGRWPRRRDAAGFGRVLAGVKLDGPAAAAGRPAGSGVPRRGRLGSGEPGAVAAGRASAAGPGGVPGRRLRHDARTGLGGVCHRLLHPADRAGADRGSRSPSPDLPPLPARVPRCAVPGMPARCHRDAGDHVSVACPAVPPRAAGPAMEQFLADPRVRPLPPLGPCAVAACTRAADGARGYCNTHYQRWRVAASPTLTLTPGNGRQAESAVAEGGQVSLRGLPPLVVVQVLFGSGSAPAAGRRSPTLTCGLPAARCAASRSPRSRTAIPAASPASRPGRCWTRWPATSAGRWPIRPRSRQGHLGPGGLRPSRAAVVHRHHPAVAAPGRQTVGRLRICPVTAAKAPPTSRRRSTRWPGCRKACEPARSRDAAGRLGRADIEAFLNRLGYLESAGTISRYHRNVICRGARTVLAGIRALGLTRPGQAAAGLPGDFAIGRRRHPRRARARRAGPGPAAGDHDRAVRQPGHPAAGRGQGRHPDRHRHRTAARRHPRPAAGLPGPRQGRRARCWSTTTPRPTGWAGACRSARPPPTVITGQQDRVRARFPGTPPAELKLLPAARRNPDGRKPITIDMLEGRHRDVGRPARAPAHPRRHRVRPGQDRPLCLPAHLRPAARRRRRADRRARRTT